MLVYTWHTPCFDAVAIFTSESSPPWPGPGQTSLPTGVSSDRNRRRDRRRASRRPHLPGRNARAQLPAHSRLQRFRGLLLVTRREGCACRGGKLEGERCGTASAARLPGGGKEHNERIGLADPARLPG